MKRLASNRDRRLQLAPAKAPTTEPAARPATPPWVPEGAAYEMLSPRAKAMIAEILEPAYEQLVLRARDALEKIGKSLGIARPIPARAGMRLRRQGRLDRGAYVGKIEG